MRLPAQVLTGRDIRSGLRCRYPIGCTKFGMHLTLIRNATLLLEIGGKRVLVDPMLAPIGALPPVGPASDERRNPLVPLPTDLSNLVDDLDAVVVTHLHRDHFDADAAERLPPETPIVTQPDSAPILRWMGFQDVRDEPVIHIGSLELSRTLARHTHDGGLLDLLGPTSSFAIAVAGEPRLLVAGDCVWCGELAAALEHHSPEVIVVNAGAGRIGTSLPISMTVEDVIATAHAAPVATVVSIHLEALSHCPMTRVELTDALRGVDLGSRVLVPRDGDRLTFERRPSESARETE